MMTTIRRWMKGISHPSAKTKDRSKELSEVRTEFLQKAAQFNRTQTQLRMAAEEVDHRLSGHHR